MLRHAPSTSSFFCSQPLNFFFAPRPCLVPPPTHWTKKKTRKTKKTKKNRDRLDKLHQAADSGDAKAMSDLGATYAIGEAVPQSWTEAFKWFKNAAEANFTLAYVNLARGRLRLRHFKSLTSC